MHTIAIDDSVEATLSISSSPISCPSFSQFISPSPLPSTPLLPPTPSRAVGRLIVPTMYSQGWCMPEVIEADLSRLMTAHRRLTSDTWNGSADHLADAHGDVDVGITNGEMQQQPYCDLMHTLMTHDNLPFEYKLGGHREQQVFFDVGSGYGLPSLRTRIISGVGVAGGVEIACDRVFISHRLTDAVQLCKDVHFIDANATSPDMLPILRAATHLFAYSAVSTSSTRSYLAEHVIASDDSNWLVYVTFDKANVLQGANITVHDKRHRHDDRCTRGGVHLAGHSPSLPMSVSGQKMQASIYIRCVPPDAVSRQRRLTAGVEMMKEKSAKSRQRGQAHMQTLLTSSQPGTRAVVAKQQQQWGMEEASGRRSGELERVVTEGGGTESPGQV